MKDACSLLKMFRTLPLMRTFSYYIELYSYIIIRSSPSHQSLYYTAYVEIYVKRDLMFFLPSKFSRVVKCPVPEIETREH